MRGRQQGKMQSRSIDVDGSRVEKFWREHAK